MKTLLTSVICTFLCFSLFAQVDSTNNTNTNNDSSMNSTPAITPPTMNTTTDTSMNNNQTPMPTMNTDTSANMNSNNSGMNMSDSSMNANLVNPNNIPGQSDYAALPVLETYVPDDIVAQVKQKHTNEVIYDITAVKAPVDSSMMHTDSMGMNQNSMAMNQSSTTDSTMNQNTTNNLNNGMAMDSTMQMPEKFNYVVRVVQGGQLMTETLESNGTALNAIKNNGWNQ
jgi:hypothetical protein